MDEMACKRMGEQMAAALISDQTESFAVMAAMWNKWIADEGDWSVRQAMTRTMTDAFCAECNRTAVADSGWGTNLPK